MNWDVVIGLETHVELSTQSKVFCGCSTAFGAPPNTLCCPVCLGLPGSLPVLNEQAVELALKAALALNCTVTPVSRFDRKNYFYPDLPKAYQISQLYAPLARDGHLDLPGGRRIRISEMHLEEDAGKLHHHADRTAVDYNRCGVPLVEIVTAPDLTGGEEAVAYLEQLRSILQYLGVSDCRMEEGSLRCDVNLSVRLAGSSELGTRTELKNLGSLRAVRLACEYEAQRQIAILESGGQVRCQTCRWDEEARRTVPMRDKEQVGDYRYFPDPDLPPLAVGEEWLTHLRAEQPELAHEKAARYARDWQLGEYDCATLTSRRGLAEFFEQVVALGAPPKQAANWIMGQVLRRLSADGLAVEEIPMSARSLADLIRLVEQGTVNRNTAVEVFDAVFTGGDPAEYVRTHRLEQSSDTEQIASVAADVLAQNHKSVEDWLSGKEKAAGFLVGQTMRALGGKAPPALVGDVVRQLLERERS
ncbi:MAG: Asp-tRNA(Asn)/Glu-tRNA(Gln) amidotransferase subunit GatB [Oscillospiraceae bacterium]|nr:Asp-tRNA(Asn)/Glu-tRNA(Gln) amidotransferase subunit GatB [Oscillospiraceae bacterium]